MSTGVGALRARCRVVPSGFFGYMLVLQKVRHRALVNHLIEAGEIDPDELAELTARLGAKRKAKKPKSKGGRR